MTNKLKRNQPGREEVRGKKKTEETADVSATTAKTSKKVKESVKEEAEEEDETAEKVPEVNDEAENPVDEQTNGKYQRRIQIIDLSKLIVHAEG